MTVTVQAHDFVIAALALLGVVMLAGAALALLVRVLGRKLPDMLEAVAAWAMVEAAGWRARDVVRVELAGSRMQVEWRRPAAEVAK